MIFKNGINIVITYLPSCRNVPNGYENPYIGMYGKVVDFDGDSFDLFTGSSWLVGIKYNTCRFTILT